MAPDEFYDALAINAASASTQISGLPFSGPIAAVRLALIGDQWVAFPKHSQLADAVFDIIVAGRVVKAADGSEDVAIMMVEAEATEVSWNLIQGGATKPNEEQRWTLSLRKNSLLFTRSLTSRSARVLMTH
jgi:polyribonucleotide nucleotidyltransferase